MIEWADEHPDRAAIRIAELERENAALRAAIAESEEFAKKNGETCGLKIRDLLSENAALHKDKERLDFLSTLTGSGWACLHLDQKGSNDDWFLTRKQIDRRMATEPKQ